MILKSFQKLITWTHATAVFSDSVETTLDEIDVKYRNMELEELFWTRCM